MVQPFFFFFFFFSGEPGDVPKAPDSGFVIKTTLLRKLPSTPQAVGEPLVTFRIPIGKISFMHGICTYFIGVRTGKEHLLQATDNSQQNSVP